VGQAALPKRIDRPGEANKLQLATVIVIAGPTASGKSYLALGLAERFDGTIINADSQQTYRDLRILTARPNEATEARVPHRLYGYLNAAERGSAARWRALAEIEIENAIAAGRLPILVGGTGLYLRALFEGLAAIPDIPDAIRSEAMSLYETLGGVAFRERLSRLDPVTAARFPPGDRTRLTRAWEVVRATGMPIGLWHRQVPNAATQYRAATLLLMPPREAIYAACDARFTAMIGAGALDEVASLATRGLSPALPAMKAVGVPELLAHLRGDVPLSDAIAAGQRATRRYAKRQMTWFRHQITPDLVLNQQYSPDLLPRVLGFIEEFLLTDSG
jgi:tRNA dimethylallyltransferase